MDSHEVPFRDGNASNKTEVEFNTNSELGDEKSDNWDLSLRYVCLVTYETQLDTDIPLEVKNDKSDNVWRHDSHTEKKPLPT